MIHVVAGICRDLIGNVLIQERVNNPYKGWWELPGGKIKPGETHAEALEREWMEELGIDIHVGTLVRSVEGVAPRGYMVHFYNVTTEQFPRSLEGQRFQWMNKQDIGIWPGTYILPKDRDLLMEIL